MKMAYRVRNYLVGQSRSKTTKGEEGRRHSRFRSWLLGSVSGVLLIGIVASVIANQISAAIRQPEELRAIAVAVKRVEDVLTKFRIKVHVDFEVGPGEGPSKQENERAETANVDSGR